MADPIQGYFNSTTYTLDANNFPIWNRAVGSEFMAKFAHTALGNGAAAVTTGGFQVVKKTGMTVTVKPYFICKDGYMMYQTGETDIEFTSSTSEQVFYIGARLDVANNHFDGDDVGAFTAFVSATDIASCKLTITANAVAITDGMIEDLRYNTTYCGQIDAYRERSIALLAELEQALEDTLAGGIPDHASTHATGGDDPITPAAIGAADAREVRAYEYGGREIPFTWAQIQAKIQAADFSGLCVGDYKTVTLAGGSFYDAADASTKTLSEQTLKMVVAGINTYHRYGDVAVGGHIDMISLHCLAPKLKYNGSATNSGGYVGSNLFTTLNGDNGIRTLLPADMAAVLAQKRALTEVKTAANASSWEWNDLGLLWLPSEQEIWGQTVWSESGYGAGLAVRYPLFDGSVAQIAKNDASDARCTWWTMNTKAGSATQFVCVRYMAYPTYYSASDPDVRVPLCVRVA